MSKDNSKEELVTQKDLELWGGQLQQQMKDDKQELKQDMKNMGKQLEKKIDGVGENLVEMIDNKIESYVELRGEELMSIKKEEVVFMKEKQDDHEERLIKVEKAVEV